MGKIKTGIAKFICNKFLQEEINALKEQHYIEEKNRFKGDLKRLEDTLREVQREYLKLQNTKFIEAVNVDLSKGNFVDNSKEQTLSNAKNPFDDWGV